MSRFRWFKRSNRETDLQDEIQSHLQMAIQQRVSDGQDPEEARLEALREFGNVSLTQEVTRGMWRPAWLRALASLLQDLRYAVRAIAKTPGFAVVVVAILALGIGANTATFSLLKAAFLKPLPGVSNPAGIVVVGAETNGGRTIPLSYPDYQYLRDHDSALSGLAVSAVNHFNMGLGKRGEQVWGELVSGNYFQVLGVRARLGRTLLPRDEVTPGAHPFVVISTGLWQSMFAADPGIIGKPIHLNGQPFTIVGVTEAGFQGSIVGMVLDIYVPLMMQPRLSPFGSTLDQRNTQWLIAFGRLRPQISMRTAQARMQVCSARLGAAYPIDVLRLRAKIIPMWRSPFGAQTFLLPVVSLLIFMSALLLVVVCANLTNLMLARGLGRQKEIAVRLALGGSRARVARLLLIESMLLSLAGAAVGFLVLAPLLGALPAGPSITPFPVDLDVSADWLVTGFTLVAALLSAVLCGFVPALRASRLDLTIAMKDEWSRSGHGRGWLRGGLVVCEIAFSFVLLVGAALVVRSLASARHANVGFDPNGVVSISLDLAPNGYNQQRGLAFYDQLIKSVKADGIESATLAAVVPLQLIEGSSMGVAIEGYQPRKNEDMSFGYNVVSPEYFRTLRIGMTAGREFNDRDNTRAPEAIIVNETMARRFWQDRAGAIGRRVRVDGKWRSVVGVARDIKYSTLTEDPKPYFYLPFLQYYMPAMTLHARASAVSPRLVERMRTHVNHLDSDLPILESQTMDQQVRFALIGYEMAASMLTAFGLLSLALAAVGTYGMLSYSVRQSRREIGIRVAIGARAVDVLGHFLRRGMRLSLLGLTLGIALSLTMTKLISSLLYGISSTDTLSFAGATALVALVAVGASFIPASRAAQVEPMTALRHE